jgi:hypothetical protein
MSLQEKLSYLRKVFEIPNVKKITFFLLLITLSPPNMDVYTFYCRRFDRKITVPFYCGMMSVAEIITILLLIVYSSRAIKT